MNKRNRKNAPEVFLRRLSRRIATADQCIVIVSYPRTVRAVGREYVIVSNGLAPTEEKRLMEAGGVELIKMHHA